MPARSRHGECYGKQQRSRYDGGFGNREICYGHGGRRWRDAPVQIDGVIVGGMSAKGRPRRVGLRVNMHVRGRGGRMVRFLGMDMQERRLEEPQEEARNA